MTEYYSRDKTFIHYAINSDLTQWDNAQAEIAAAECQALDNFLGGFVLETDPRYIAWTRTPGSYYQKKTLAGRSLGQFTGGFHFQTGILAYMVSNICTTAEGTPNTHTQTLSNANLKTSNCVPVTGAFHFEKKTAGTNIEHRLDAMGLVNPRDTILCSERTPIGTQAFSTNFAYTDAVAGDLALTATLDALDPYTWYDLMNGGITFQFNSVDVAVKVVSVDITLGWTGFEADVFDVNAYPTEARHIPPFITDVALGIRPYDHASHVDIKTIKNASLTAGVYSTGDLDLTLDFKKSTTHYCKFTYDKLYLVPESFQIQIQGENSWYDGYRINLTPISDGSSLVIEEKNSLNNDYYENP